MGIAAKHKDNRGGKKSTDRGREYVLRTRARVSFLIMFVLVIASCGLLRDDERELIERVDVELPTEEGELEKEILVSIEGIRPNGDFDRDIVVSYEIVNPSATSSVNVALTVGLQGVDPETQSDDFVTEFELETEEVESDEEVWLDYPPLAHTLSIEIEATDQVHGQFDVYVRPVLD